MADSIPTPINGTCCAPSQPPTEPNPPIPQPQSHGTCIHSTTSARNRPSNEYVLNVAFVTFIGFVVIEAIFAVIAKSQSMLADAEAMSVDAMTYLLNLVAERIKHTPYSVAELQLTPPVRHYRRELVRLYLEFLPPMISVVTLMVVTVVAVQNAMITLRRDYPNDGSEKVEDNDTSLPIMLIFSAGNLVLDILNVTCFARAHNAFGLQAVERETPSSMLPPDVDVVADDDDDNNNNGSNNYEDAAEKGNNTITGNHYSDQAVPVTQENVTKHPQLANEETSLLHPRRQGSLSTGTTTTNPHLTTLDSFRHNRDEPERAVINLNMCSAWTHVCADTLRSLAVLVAAGVATFVPGIQSGVADAAAAVAVSVIIFASLIPLLHGLFEISCEIYEHWTRKP